MFKSTDAASNASTQPTFYNKSTFEKMESQNDMFSNPEYADSIYEVTEKQVTNLNSNHGNTKKPVPHSDYPDKLRSQSVDAYSRRKSTHTSYNGKIFLFYRNGLTHHVFDRCLWRTIE